MNKHQFLFLRLLCVIVTEVVFSGCAHTPTTALSVTPTFVFIQGMHLDGKVWDKTKSLIDAHAFHTMDLGRLGRDEKQPASLKNIALFACTTIPANSILVAHSDGGAIANEMVGICDEKISKIIYVSAVVPLIGEKPFDLLADADQVAYAKAVRFKKQKIIPNKAKFFFAATDHQVNLHHPLPHLYPEWMSLSEEPLEYNVTHFNAIPKVYLYTAKDPVITLSTQSRYTERTKITDTDSLATGHFPMLSDPTTLAALLQKWAK